MFKDSTDDSLVVKRSLPSLFPNPSSRRISRLCKGKCTAVRRSASDEAKRVEPCSRLTRKYTALVCAIVLPVGCRCFLEHPSCGKRDSMPALAYDPCSFLIRLKLRYRTAKQIRSECAKLATPTHAKPLFSQGYGRNP